MAPSNETKLAEQQSNDQSPTTPPTLMIRIIPSFDPARKNQTQAESEVEILTPTTHATGTEGHHSKQIQVSPEQVEASTTTMDIPSGGINPQQQFLMGAVTVAPLQWIITTPENYGADYGHEEGLFDSDSDCSDGGDEVQSDSVSDNGDDEQQSGSDSGADDGHGDDEGEHSYSDSGDTGGGDSGSDSGDADDERQSGSDSGDSDNGDEEQSGSDAGDDDEEEENEEEETEEGEEAMDVDDEHTATPTGVNADDGGNNSLSTPGSIDTTYEDAEQSDPGISDLTLGSSEDNDGPNIRSPVTATSAGPENGDGESSDEVELAEGASVLRTLQQRARVTMEDPRTARTPASTSSGQGNVNGGQTQRVTPVAPEQVAEENDDAVSSDVASEEDALASSQEDEDMKIDSEEDDISGTLRFRGGAGEPDMEGSHGEEEIELTGSEGPLLPSEIPESTMGPEPGSQRNEEFENSGNEQGEAQGQAVSPVQDLEDTANQPNAMIYDGQDDTNLDSPEIPETPPRGRHGEDHNDSDHNEGGAASSPELPGSLFPRYQRSEVGSEDSQDSQEPADPSEQDLDDDASEPDRDDWDAGCIEADHFEFSEEIPENPPQSAQRLGDDPADFDLDEGDEVSSPVDRVAFLTGYRRSDANNEDDQADEYQGGECSIDRQQSKGKSSDCSPKGCSNSDDPVGEPDRTDEKTIHLRVQYLVARSKRSKASMCLWIPTDIPYPVFQQTILNALQQHNGTPNPHPAHPDAVIARLLLFIAGSKPIQLKSDNLQQNLALMPQRSIYDYVKVEFVPETNGEMRRRKGTGKVNGRCGKVGGL